MKPTLLILAAGMGSRYKSLKQIDAFGPNGEMIIDYSIYDAIQAGYGKVIFVIRKDIEQQFRKIFDNRFDGQIEIDYVYQESDLLPQGISPPAGRVKPWGTGHAVLVAAPKLDTPFTVINADDFYGRNSIATIAKHLIETQNDTSLHYMVGYQLQYTLSENGSVSRGVCQKDSNNNLQSITERTSIYRKDKGQIVYSEENTEHPLQEEDFVSMNIFGFTPTILPLFETEFIEFLKENKNKPKSEFYIPTVVNKIIDEKKGAMKVLPTTSRWFGVTYPEDKPNVQKDINKLIEQGVYPTPLWL